MSEEILKPNDENRERLMQLRIKSLGKKVLIQRIVFISIIVILAFLLIYTIKDADKVRSNTFDYAYDAGYAAGYYQALVDNGLSKVDED